MTTKVLESYIIRTTFCLVLLAPFGTFSQILKLKDYFGIIYPSLKKFKNGPLKIKNSKIRARHISSMLIWVQKDIWVQDTLLLEVWVMGYRVPTYI